MRSMILCLALAALCNSAGADIETFEVVYDGNAFGNTATATGLISLDTDIIVSPGDFLAIVGTEPVPQFSLEIQGASSGNGTFFNDANGLGFVELNFSQPIDFTQNLVGQAGFSAFNILSLENEGPIALENFVIGTNFGNGDQLELVSFNPVSVVPEPGGATVLLFSAAALIARRRKIR